MKKLFGVPRISETGFVDQPIELQRKKVIDDSNSLQSEDIDKLSEQERELELQQIERFKMSGM